MHNLDITFIYAEKRRETKNSEAYMAYGVVTKPSQPADVNAGSHSQNFVEDEYLVWRRYTHFEQLFHHLMTAYPWAIIPPLPPKREVYNVKRYMENFEKTFIENRRHQLQRFMRRIAAHPLLCHDEVFYRFVQDVESPVTVNSGLLDKAVKTTKRLMNKNATVDPRIESLVSFSAHIETACSNMIKFYYDLSQKEAALAEFYGRASTVYKNWSELEEWGKILEATSHFMAQEHTSAGEMDMTQAFLFPMQEYALYANQIRRVVTNWEENLVAIADVEADIESNKHQLAALEGRVSESVFKGLTNKVFGSPTMEQREQQARILEDDISTAQSRLSQMRTQHTKFMENLEEDHHRFRQVKHADFKRLMSDLCRMRIQSMSKSLNSWKNIQQCYKEYM